MESPRFAPWATNISPFSMATLGRILLINSTKIFTLCRGVAAILLFITVFSNSQTFFSIIKVVVTGVAILGIAIYLNKDNETKQNSIILLFYFVLFFLFNPIYEVSFERYKWIPIDIICGLLLILSVVIHESNFISKVNLEKVFRKSIFTFALLIIVLGFYLTAIEFIEPLNLNYLKNNGKQVVGRITKISPNLESSTDQDGGIDGVFVVSYELDYKFTLENGERFSGNTDNGENPIKNISGEEFMDKYSMEYTPSKLENYPIQIFYQQSNPLNNRAIYDVKVSLALLIFRALFPYVIITGFIIFMGFGTCKKVLNNEIITNRNI